MTQEPLKVLLIEDDRAHRFLFQNQLENVGLICDLEFTTTLDSALDVLESRSFDIIVTDIGLPDESGPEVVRQLTEVAPDSAVIVLTSDDREVTEERVFELGAQDYIPKHSSSSKRLDFTMRHALHRQHLRIEHRRMRETLMEQKQILASNNRRLEKLLDTAHKFVDNVSHEFRTPLTVIREYTSLMRDGLVGNISREQGEFLDIVADRADDLSIMVDDMLDSSRMEAGIMGVSRVMTDPADIVRRVLPGLERKAACRGAELRSRLDSDLPYVFCDPEKVGRALTNLVANAIKFCGEPGQIDLEVTSVPDSNEVHFSVTDNGLGIAPEEIALLGQRFRQVGTVSRTSSNGFGLGLNIAFELVALNLGHMRVKSEVGRGSIFGFSVPVHDVDEIVSRYLELSTVLETGQPADDSPGNSGDGLTADSIRSSDRSSPSVPIAWLQASIPRDTDEATTNEIDAFWRFTQRHHDLILRTQPTSWLLLCPSSPANHQQIIERLKGEYRKRERNRPRGRLPELTIDYRGAFSIPDDSARILNSLRPARIEAPHLLKKFGPGIAGHQTTPGTSGRLKTI